MAESNASHRSSAEVRRALAHPILDADGHFVEVWPLAHAEIAASIEQDAGRELRDRFLAGQAQPFDTTTAARTVGGDPDRWQSMPSWWGWPTENVLDRATSYLPKLLYDRLDEIGLDVSIVYPSMSLNFLDLEDAELAGAACRAVNAMHARLFAPYRDRLIVGALIPMNTPSVAIATLEHAVGLGLKAGAMSGYVRRPIAKLAREHGRLDPPVHRYDNYGMDSEYDYDPFWRRCCALRFAPISHSSDQYHNVARSPSSYVFNHVGGLARGHEALCKRLFLGGVTRRFPALRIGFLEGGVGWACSLYADLIGHYSKRGGGAIRSLDPDRLDVGALMKLFEVHGDASQRAGIERVRRYFEQPAGRPARLDEFDAVGLETAEDIRERFVPSFFFGCEADDPLVAWAFADRVNPFGAKLRAMLGSDISHWDVSDMREPIAESYEAVEAGRLSEADYRDFAFGNAVRFHGGMNPDFFAGTIVEAEAARLLAEDAAKEARA
jgi:predicted TIM-barrel fold metal-dependent hydrolase